MLRFAIVARVAAEPVNPNPHCVTTLGGAVCVKAETAVGALIDQQQGRCGTVHALHGLCEAWCGSGGSGCNEATAVEGPARPTDGQGADRCQPLGRRAFALAANEGSRCIGQLPCRKNAGQHPCDEGFINEHARAASSLNAAVSNEVMWLIWSASMRDVTCAGPPRQCDEIESLQLLSRGVGS